MPAPFPPFPNGNGLGFIGVSGLAFGRSASCGFLALFLIFVTVNNVLTRRGTRGNKKAHLVNQMSFKYVVVQYFELGI
ncbi:MAG TPA: hypothetical protein VFZ42_07220 [Chitinophagaceae bacterium]